MANTLADCCLSALCCPHRPTRVFPLAGSPKPITQRLRARQASFASAHTTARAQKRHHARRPFSPPLPFSHKSSRTKIITKYHSLYHRPLPRSNPDNPATSRADPLTHNFSILPTYPSLGGDATRKANNQQRHNPCPSLSAATDVTIQPQDHPQPEASARRLFHCSLPAQAHLHRSRQQEFLPVAESHRCRREESNCLTPRPDWHHHARHASQRLCGRPLARSRRCRQRAWGYVWNCALRRQCEGKGWTVCWRRVGQGVCSTRKE